ncbi:hypothetical protein PSA01_21990 [Pseudonocardia saturnea]|nr:hypothetical protein Pdca_41370 [Pseudonocardia autotrophica]GEC25170.1 hypothetical protein PSA01_21990 [Pseudonocardia saturnea]
MRRTLIGAAAVAASAALFAPVAFAGDGSGDHGSKHGAETSGLTAMGLAHDTLVKFTTSDAGAVAEIGTITGLTDADKRLVGLDYRVQDGKLYGVGDGGGIYTVDESNASATEIGRLSVDLDGKNFGVDFNPAANALRVVSDTGQNLRQPFATMPLAATVEDTDLTNPATAPATGTVPATGVTAAGYTNNDLSASTATTLFVLDTDLDRVSVQSPANSGTLAPTGSLPADIGAIAGLDVYSTLTDGVTTANDAFATVDVAGSTRLWKVDLLTGSAQDLGELAAPVGSLAIKLDQ